MAVSGLLVLALAGCDSTSRGELVMAPEEPLCHPWPSCTSWTTDTESALTLPTPAKLIEGVKAGHLPMADFEFSVTGESVRVRLKSGGRYRLEFDGPEESVILRGPGTHAMALPAISGLPPGASGFRTLEFTARQGGKYEIIAGSITDRSVRVWLYAM